MRLVWEILGVVGSLTFLAIFWAFVSTRWWIGAALVIVLPALMLWELGVGYGRRHPAQSIFDREIRDD